MSTIIAGTFESTEQAEHALQELRRAGIADADSTTLFVNPPGQHGTFPIGGDENKSTGAKKADVGAAAGAGIGTAIGIGLGVVAAPLAGPIAAVGLAGAGAYVGALVGAMNQMGEKETEPAASPGAPRVDVEEAPTRTGGVLVAARAQDATVESTVIRTLRQGGATQIERAEGRWEGGVWVDFDPVRTPALVAG